MVVKKLILTENQIKKLTDNVINENLYGDKFGTKVYCTFHYYDLKYKGNVVEDILPIELHLTFDIDIEYRRMGIKGITVYNIDGPKTIEAEIEFYPNSEDDYNLSSEIVELEVNWGEEVNSSNDESLVYFGVSPDVEIELSNDNEGNVVIKEVKVLVRNL